MSNIAVDTSIVSYALKFALISDDDEQVNYVCNRLIETVPQMQKTLCVWCIQDIEKYLDKGPQSFTKRYRLIDLYDMLKVQLKEFA